MHILITPRSFVNNRTKLELALAKELALLKESKIELIYNESGKLLTREYLEANLANCLGLVLGLEKIGADLLAKAPNLRAIAKYGVGLDNLDLVACQEHGIKISTTKGVLTNTVADYTLALILACARQIPKMAVQCQKGIWQKLPTLDLENKILGIIGLGQIGKAVAKRAKIFGLKIIAFDPKFDQDFATENDITFCDLPELCAKADFISLHADLNEQSRNLLNANYLNLFKESAIFINTARAELVDNFALLEILQNHKIFAAALDTFDCPPVERAWYKLDNLILSAHCASSTPQTVHAMSLMALGNLLTDLNLTFKKESE